MNQHHAILPHNPKRQLPPRRPLARAPRRRGAGGHWRGLPFTLAFCTHTRASNPCAHCALNPLNKPTGRCQWPRSHIVGDRISLRVGSMPSARRACIGALLCAAAAAAAASPAAAPPRLTIDGRARAHTFDGHGALSAGASSRLLFDYPAAQRADILDLLFLPSHGMSLHTLKLEIGGDTQSTDGSEASHSHFRGDLSCARGYELWLAREAVARNPAIQLYALSWGVPQWVGNGSFFTADNIFVRLFRAHAHQAGAKGGQEALRAARAGAWRGRGRGRGRVEGAPCCW